MRRLYVAEGSATTCTPDRPLTELKAPEINLAWQPDLVLLDGRRSTVNWDGRGEYILPNVIMASGDMVALDVEAVKILQGYPGKNKIGGPARSWDRSKVAAALGLGSLDYAVVEGGAPSAHTSRRASTTRTRCGEVVHFKFWTVIARAIARSNLSRMAEIASGLRPLAMTRRPGGKKTHATSNKVTLITGAGRGLGQAVAVAYARQGARVIVTGRTPDELEHTAGLIRSAGGHTLALTVDVADDAAMAAMAGEVLGRYGRLDVLVNNRAR